MPKYYRDLVPFKRTYLAGTCAACGTTSTAITVPAGASTVFIHAEGAALYWQANGTAAIGTVAPGYVAADGHAAILPIDNLGTLHVVGAGTAGVAHIEFYQD